MTMSWMFLLVVFAALCGFAIVIVVLVMLLRAATRQSGGVPDGTRRTDDGHFPAPPILPADDSIHRQYLMSQTMMDSSPSAPSVSDSVPSSSGDSGSSSSSSDSGSGCG